MSGFLRLARFGAAALVLGAAIVSFGAARAQSFAVTGFGAPISAQAPAGPPAQKTATSVIRHLTNNIQGFRLAGEIAASEWPLYLTSDQAHDTLRFQIGYLAAVSVMPEASVLSIALNGVVIGITHIRAAAGERTASFPIPDGLLKPGFNSVRISAEQRHRVDCSLKASYELWTQIDPASTGLLLPSADPGVTNIGDLPALAPDAEGALPIRVVLPERASSHDLDRLVRAVELISLVGRFEQPIVDIGPLAGGRYGVNLVIGDVAELSRRMPDMPLAGVSGPRVVVVPASKQLRTTIIVTGLDQSEVDAALAQIVAAHGAEGTGSGLLAARAFPGFRIKGAESVTLRHLGVRSEEFSGRMFRTSFDLIMPPDFYSADYAKVFIHLAGGYAPGLERRAQVLVKVNGRDASSLQLPDRSGDVFSDKTIPVPLGFLRPGFNRFEIEAQLPERSDHNCDPLKAARGANRFLFLDSTSIDIPPIARIARMPDLAVTATGGFPYARGGAEPKLWLPKPNSQSVAAAATIVAHLAVAAGEPIDFHLTVKRPAAKGGPVLVIAPATAIGRSLVGAVGLDPRAVAEAWRNRFSEKIADGDPTLTKYQSEESRRRALQRNLPAACRLERTRTGQTPFDSSPKRAVGGEIASLGSIGGERRSTGLAREWAHRIKGRTRWSKWMTDLPGAAHDVLRFAIAQVGGWFGEQNAPAHARSAIDQQTSLIVAQNILGDRAPDVWTLVTAPTSAQLFDSVGCLVDPRVWGKLSGRMSALDASSGAVVTRPVRFSRLIVTQPLSLQNTRLIVASWFSLNGGVYVLAALVTALSLALSTACFVRNVGRRQE